MKRVISLLLAILMITTSMPISYAATTTETTLNYDLTCEDKHVITVPSGAEITVAFRVENKTEGENFKVGLFQNEVFYDHEFFEFLGEENIELISCSTGELHVPSNGKHLIYLNDMRTREYEPSQLVATFKLKVTATEGQSTISSLSRLIFDNNSDEYNTIAEDLTVIVGDVYDITYTSDGEIVEQLTALENEEITVSGAPYKYGYDFAGWMYDGTVYMPDDVVTVTEDIDFVAVWAEIPEYTVSFVTNCGYSIDDVVEFRDAEIDLSLYEPINEHFIFDGWYIDEELNTPADDVIVLVEDITLYAKWIPEEYTLSFNTGCDIELDDLAVKYDEVVDITEYELTREHFDFEGWYESEGSTTPITEIKITGDTTVYAKWTEHVKFTVSFDTDGGSTIEDVEDYIGETVDLTKYNPTREGYEFGGWVDEDGKPIIEIVLGEDVTVKAIWTAHDHTITFVTNGGTDVEDEAVKYDEEIDFNDFVTTKKHYDFNGWYTDSALTNKITANVIVNGDITVYAGWTEHEKFTVSFDTDGGSTIEDVEDYIGETVDLTKYNPTREGYEFSGWVDEDGTPITEIVLGEDVTVKATWEANDYTLFFETGCDIVVDNLPVEYDDEIDLTQYELTRAHYDFNGWCESEGSTTPITEIKITGDTTVYAKWTEHEKFTVSFDTDGGSTIEDVEDYIGETVDLTKYNPTREGYDFEKWIDEDGNPIDEIVLGEDVTVKATWTAHDHTITFVTNGGSAVEDEAVKYDEEIDFNDFVTSKDHFDFDGWYTDAALTEKITANVVVKGDMTVYAKWTEHEKFTVSFDTDGGSDVESVTDYIGTLINLNDKVPQKEGYTFDGWKNDDGEVVTEIILNENTKLTAQWIINVYSLNFETNGGKKITSKRYEYGTEVLLESFVTTFENHDFVAWHDSVSLDSPVDKVVINDNITVYAQWSIKPIVTVTFDTKGGSPVSPVSDYRDKVINLNDFTPEFEGHEFAGWYFDESYEVSADFITLTNDITVYAKWSTNTYTLSFDTNGGTSVGSVNRDYGTVANLLGFKTSRDYYDFDGWYSDEALTQKITSITIYDNTTVYAGWKEIPKYTVSFNTDGGTEVTPITDYRDTVVDLTEYITEKEGHDFICWVDVDGNPITEIVLGNNVEVRALWKVNTFTLTFVTDGGSAISAKTVEYGKIVDLTAFVTSKPHHDFVGWYKSKEADISITEIEILGNTTVYAKWKEHEKFTVTFDAGNGNVITFVTDYIGETIDITKYKPEKEGYDFVGWTDENGNFVTEIVLSGSVKVVAQWEAKEYILKFVTNGGSELDKVKVKYDSVVALSIYTTSRKHYDFNGWYSDKACTKLVDDVTIKGNTTVYAGWKEHEKFTVTFETGEGTSVAPVTDYVGERVYLLRYESARNGFRFNGWADKDGNPVTEIILMEDVKVYAQWTAGGYSLYFETNGGSLIASKAVKYGETVELDDYETIKANHDFNGWYSDRACTKLVEDVLIAGDTTVYAGWTEHEKFTVKFNTDGGEEIAPVSDYVGNKVDLTRYEPEKTGYKFVGWIDENGNPVTEIVLDNNFEVTAQWNVSGYKLYFDTDGGTKLDSVDVEYGVVVDLSGYISEKENYSFNGWYSDAACTQKITSVAVVGNTTVYAGWTEHEKFTVMFETNGGSEISSVDYYKDSIVYLSIYVPEKDNHGFDGWYYDEELTQVVTYPITVTEDVTVYAKWLKDAHTVKFDTGEGSSLNPKAVPHGETLDLTSIVTDRPHYDFNGWYSDESLKNKINSVVVNENITVYAGWTEHEKFTLTFVTNGGSAIADVVDYYETDIDLSEYVTTYNGHSFVDWFMEEELINRVDTIILREDTSVYAKWLADEVTVTFVSNGGTDVEAVTVRCGETVDFDLYISEKTNHRFDGWFFDEQLTNKVTGETYITEDVTVYAKFTEVRTLTFVTNGGSEISPIIETVGSIIDLSQYRPTRSNYTFKGWFAESTLQTPVTSVTLNENVTVYAKWTRSGGGGGGGGGGGSSETQYTIKFESNGGTAIDQVTKYKNTTVDLSKYLPVLKGYVFDGWYTDKSLTQKVEKIVVTEDVTLYAKWIEEKPEDENDNKEDETQVKPIDPNYKPDILTNSHTAYILGRDDGLIHPKANLTRAEAATIFFRLLEDDVRTSIKTNENVFTDVNDGDWFNTAVSTLASIDVLKGRTSDTFAPNEPITRAELTAIVTRLSEAKYDGENLFNDIDGHWAENYINTAASIGWVQGDGDGSFRPNDRITRAEVVTLVNRALNRQPESKDDLLDGMTEWEDNSEDAWYYIAIQEATNSHEYKSKGDGVHEIWTRFAETPDWTVYEN